MKSEFMETINELMTLERLLLEIDARVKLELTLGDAVKLSKYLEEIGEITSLYFSLQEEHFRKYNDAEKLNEYHNRLSGDTIDYDTRKVKKFINDVSSKVVNKELGEILSKNRYWSYI